MAQFESIRQRMRDFVVGSSSNSSSIVTSDQSSSSSSSFVFPSLSSAPAGMKPNAEERKILEKIEQQNRLLEADRKSITGGGSSSTPPSPPPLDEKSRKVWEHIIGNWDDYHKNKQKQLKEYIRKGIPRAYRGIAWQRLCGCHDDVDAATSTYCRLLKMSSPSEKLIRRDITRTYPEMEFFQEGQRGQNVLFNVIKAYSIVDKEVGYCQGSAFIAGLILLHLPEEQSFAIFLALMQNYGLRDIFKPSMENLGLCMFQFESLLQDHCSELFEHLQQEQLHTSCFASSWFLTLMATTFNFSLASRILDVFISEGMEVIFRLGLSILLDNKDTLLKMDMEKMLMFIQKDCTNFYNENGDVLFERAYKLVRYSDKKMKKLEREYHQARIRENEEMKEMKSLTTENRLLIQRIQRLEAENQNLADKLIQDRVNRAMEAEERIRMEKELSIAKRKANNNNNPHDKDASSEAKAAEKGSKEEEDREDYVKEIEEQLVKAKIREADSSMQLTVLQEKCCDLAERNRELTEESRVVELESELIAVKLREAEASNAMKELTHQVNLLKLHYQRYQEQKQKGKSGRSANGGGGGSHNTKQIIQELQDEVMQMRLEDGEWRASCAQLKQEIMKLETENQMCMSRLRRCEDDRSLLKEKTSLFEENKKIFTQQLSEAEARMTRAESQYEETANKLRLLEAETTMKQLNNHETQADDELSSAPSGGGGGDAWDSVTSSPGGATMKVINRLQQRVIAQQRRIDRLLTRQDGGGKTINRDEFTTSSSSSDDDDDEDLILVADHDVEDVEKPSSSVAVTANGDN